jgi:hypothetical protein
LVAVCPALVGPFRISERHPPLQAEYHNLQMLTSVIESTFKDHQKGNAHLGRFKMNE